jgi:putative transposase
MTSEETCARAYKPRSDAAIVYGSASSGPARRPASIRATCEAIGLARSTYYYQSHRDMSAIHLEHKLVLRLHELRDLYPNDGYRRMTQQLQTEGFHVNRKRIARLMQLHNLTTKPLKPGFNGTSSYQPRADIANLLQTVRLPGPHKAWVADIAYVHLRSALVYAAAIIDVFSRDVIGYAASLQIGGRLAGIALHSAVRAHRPAPGCIHHSLSGTQYLMRGYFELLRQFGLVPSLGNGANGSRQVIELDSFEAWDDVAHCGRGFIQTVYSRERIDLILAQN